MRKSAHITPAAAALLSAVCFSIYAQDAAPEDAAALQEQPKSKWTFSVAGGYDVRSGNTESEAFNGHAESYLDSEIINFRWTMDGAYAEQTNEQDDGTKTDERTAGNL